METSILTLTMDAVDSDTKKTIKPTNKTFARSPSVLYLLYRKDEKKHSTFTIIFFTRVRQTPFR